jgi:predicted acyl esterase
LADRIEVPFLSAGNWGGLGLHLRGNVTAFTASKSKFKWLEMHEPRVLLTVRDPRGFFRRKEEDWPLPRTQWTKYWLDAATKSVASDPAPAKSEIGYAALSEEVTFMSPPFATDTEFTGPVAAKLFVSSTTTDMDIFLTLRAFDPNGTEVTFVGANDPQAPVSQGWLRASQRKLDPARSKPHLPYHPHDEVSKLTPDNVYEVDVEIWPTSIVYPQGYRLGLTIGGKGFERPEATGLMKGSGLFLHNDPADRPASEFGGFNRILTGGDSASYLLLPMIPSQRGGNLD